jgi:hypothetical protein
MTFYDTGVLFCVCTGVGHIHGLASEHRTLHAPEPRRLEDSARRLFDAVARLAAGEWVADHVDWHHGAGSQAAREGGLARHEAGAVVHPVHLSEESSV